jgi:hypothetical protein
MPLAAFDIADTRRPDRLHVTLHRQPFRLAGCDPGGSLTLFSAHHPQPVNAGSAWPAFGSVSNHQRLHHHGGERLKTASFSGPPR